MRKRSRDVVSKNLHPQKVSKRSRETRNETSRDRRGRKRPFIEDVSDGESIDGNTRNTKRLEGKQTASQKESVLSKLRRRFPRDSSDEEKNSNSNAHSFYGRSTRRTRQQELPNHENEGGEHDGDGEVAHLKQTRRNTGCEYRRIRRDQIVGKNSTLYFFPLACFQTKQNTKRTVNVLEGTNRNAYDTRGNCIGAVAFEFSL